MTSDQTLRVKTPELRLVELEQKHLSALMRIQTLERWIEQIIPRLRTLEEGRQETNEVDEYGFGILEEAKEESCDGHTNPEYIGDIGHHNRPRAVPGV